MFNFIFFFCIFLLFFILFLKLAGISFTTQFCLLFLGQFLLVIFFLVSRDISLLFRILIHSIVSILGVIIQLIYLHFSWICSSLVITFIIIPIEFHVFWKLSIRFFFRVELSDIHSCSRFFVVFFQIIINWTFILWKLFLTFLWLVVRLVFLGFLSLFRLCGPFFFFGILLLLIIIIFSSYFIFKLLAFDFGILFKLFLILPLFFLIIRSPHSFVNYVILVSSIPHFPIKLFFLVLFLIVLVFFFLLIVHIEHFSIKVV
mmetsp:Transcript_3810/g.5319  ORF Transcript_3810/g.5319 Transcript_3810/m.5319 type:complete len:259 (-) Transcript_3810:335-1111(-)